MDVLVTVGMGHWPFDRLLEGVRPLCTEHRVFVQTGTSTVAMPCENAPFIGQDELEARLSGADLVITHAGNTVRLAQRLGKLPIVTAREAKRGEMGNDHQVPYLRREEAAGRVVAAWDPVDIPRLVRDRVGPWRLTSPLPPPSAQVAARRLMGLWQARRDNPFSWRRHALFAYLWEELADRPVRHLHIGAGGEVLERGFGSRPDVSIRSFDTIPSAARASSDVRMDSVSVSPGIREDMGLDEIARLFRDRITTNGLMILAYPSDEAVDVVTAAPGLGFETIRRHRIGGISLLTLRRV